MMHTFTADRLNQRSIIRTLNVFSNPGYLFIRFPVPDGFEVFKILTGNNYVYMVNANGYGELFEGLEMSPDLEPRQEPRLSTLRARANHCLLCERARRRHRFAAVPAELRQFPTAPREPMPLEQPARSRCRSSRRLHN